LIWISAELDVLRRNRSRKGGEIDVAFLVSYAFGPVWSEFKLMGVLLWRDLP